MFDPSDQGLFGRHQEREVLERLLDRASTGEAQTLVIEGEAGVGKTALIDYLVSRATSFQVQRAVGVESEMELAFAGVHQICAGLLDRLDLLPGPQQEALGTAFGLTSGQAPDRFLVGLGVLQLLSAVAEERPLLCLIDDTQWLDRNSSQVMAFVARRLLAEPIGIVFSVREPIDELVGIPDLTIGALKGEDARALLDSVLPGRLDARVRDRVLAETQGNPLAILELAREFTVNDMAGGFGFPDERPMASRLEQSFGRRISQLPAETQMLCLVAAAEPLGDGSLLWRAAELLEIGPDHAEPAVAAGLLDIGARVRFRHPLVRSACYRQGSLTDRRRAHLALSEATDGAVDPDRRAWHRAQAAAKPDEEVAGELERSATRAHARGGIAAAAAFLERAAELTPAPETRAQRALAAAQASIEAGSLDTAYRLLLIAEIGPLDDLQHVLSARLRARILFSRSRGGDAPPVYLEAARQMEPLDGALARETYLEALSAALFSDSPHASRAVREIAEAARAAVDTGPRPPRPLDLVLEGMATRFTEGLSASVEPLRAALQAFRHEDLHEQSDIVRWLWLAPIAQEAAVHELWDDDFWHEVSGRAVALAREVGALSTLPVSLAYRSGSLLYAGDMDNAQAAMNEADAITEVTGNARVLYASLVLAAWRGVEDEALRLIEADVIDATRRGEGRVLGVAGYARAVLYNGLGRYEEALTAAREATEQEDLGFFGWSLVELVEAAVRAGASSVAAAALAALQRRTEPSGSDWALGSEARSRALLTEGDAAESLYREAIERFERTRINVHLARCQLIYGEWLRRENRRVDARQQLRLAHELFDATGAAAFAERARRELMATGETVRKRSVETRFILTAQESQVAQLAAEGNTNPEIGNQLFISPRTVEYHLHKVYAKLGITSRRDLRRALS